MTMRFATCLVAALLSSATLTTQIAAACGGYESVRRAPAVMTLTTHIGYPGSDTTAPTRTRRSFAITSASVDVAPGTNWERVAPHSYDATDFITLAPGAARTMTLVGPSGARVIRTDARVALRDAMFKPDSKFEAFELSIAQDEAFEIALAGRHTDAVWHKVTFTYWHRRNEPRGHACIRRPHVEGHAPRRIRRARHVRRSPRRRRRRGRCPLRRAADRRGHVVHRRGPRGTGVSRALRRGVLVGPRFRVVGIRFEMEVIVV
jgi:hypothetical protein